MRVRNYLFKKKKNQNIFAIFFKIFCSNNIIIYEDGKYFHRLWIAMRNKLDRKKNSYFNLVNLQKWKKKSNSSYT